MLLCVIGSTVILILSPDTIPVHFNFKGEIDRFGSKYEGLLFPCITLLLGAFLMLSAKKQRGKGEHTNEKAMLITAVSTIVFFDAITFMLILGIIFVLFGIMNPAIAKLTPWMIDFFQTSLRRQE